MSVTEPEVVTEQELRAAYGAARAAHPEADEPEPPLYDDGASPEPSVASLRTPGARK